MLEVLDDQFAAIDEVIGEVEENVKRLPMVNMLQHVFCQDLIEVFARYGGVVAIHDQKIWSESRVTSTFR